MSQTNTLPPAVVVSGLTMSLGVVRALGMMGVPVTVLRYDQRDTAHVSRWCRNHLRVPNPEKCEAAFIEALIAYATQSGGGLLFPVTDEAVVAVARNKDCLDRFYTTACPQWEVARLCIEKQHTYELAHAVGVPAPRTAVPSSVEDVEKYGRGAEFPCLVKPCQSHLFYERFHRKLVPVSNTEEMVAVYQEARNAGLEVMLQEIIPGGDTHVVNYNAYFQRGNPAVEFTAEHIRNAPPLWGSPRVVLSKDIPEVVGPGRRFFQAIKFDGYACTEFKRDPRDGCYKLMDVNPRHNLSTLLAVRCGINFPWLHYRHLAFGELPAHSGFRRNVYWIDLTRDLAYSARYRKHERYSLAEYVRPYLSPHVFAILDWKDPAPFLKRCGGLAGQAARGVIETSFGTRPRRDVPSIQERLRTGKA